MKRMLRLGFALMLAGIVALLGTMSPAFGKTVQGTVVSMDAGGVVIRGADGLESEYMLGPGVVMPAGVQAGSTVEITVGDGEAGYTITGIAAVPAAQSVPQTTSSSSQTPSETPVGATEESASPTDAELPATASPTWALGLLGVVILAGGIALNRRRRTRPRIYYRAS